MLIGKKIIGTVAYMGGIMALPEPFVHSWQQMIEYNDEYLITSDERIIYDRATASYHSFARNMLAEHMKGDWLLMLDTDITFEPDVLSRMLLRMTDYKSQFNWDLDVLVAPYVYKAEPHPPVLYGWDPDKKTKFILDVWQSDTNLIPIWGAGAGCLLVRRRVFDKIRAKLHRSPFDIYVDKEGSPLSEDHSFFQRCWDLKIKCFAAPDITVKHLIYKELDIYKDYDRSAISEDIKKIPPFWKK